MFGIKTSFNGKSEWYSYNGKRPELFDTPEEAKGYIRAMIQRDSHYATNKKHTVEKFKESTNRKLLFENILFNK